MTILPNARNTQYKEKGEQCMSEEAIKYLRRTESGVVTDSLGRLGLSGWMDYLLPVQPGVRIAGRAFTVKLAPKRGIGGSKENFYSLIRRAEPGDILVIEALGSDAWILGENTVHAAEYRGLGGMVLDGRVRDVAEIRKIALPVFSRGAAVRPHSPFLELVDYGVPIRCAGAQVRPGDIIVGDEDGAVVVPAERLEEVVVQVRDLEVLEKEQEEVIKKGGSLEELNDVLQRKKIVKR